MAQRTRGSHWTIAVAVAAALAVPGGASARLVRPARPAPQAQPQPQPQPQPQTQPQVRTPARNPAGAAKALAALARFANGQLGNSPYDKRLAAALGKLPGGRAIAKRIVSPYEGMSVADRGVVFVGEQDLDKLTIRPFDRARFDSSRTDKLKPAAGGATLPPDVLDPKSKTQYELVYRGMQVARTADADGTDEPVVFTSVFWPGPANDPYKQAARTLPESGTLGVVAGASSAASAAQVWSSPSWPGGWNSGIVLLSAVLEDNGDLAQRKDDLNLLIAFASSEASEDSNPDRMAVLRRELEDTLDLLHLANHTYWDSKAIQVRLVTAAEYDQLFLQAPKPSPFPHKLEMSHNPRGGDYTLYFDIPAPQLSYKTVVITVKQLEAIGSDRDKYENKLADFGLDVAINGNTLASVSRSVARDKNLFKSSWSVERKVLAGGNISLLLRLWDQDPAPASACTSSGGWPYSVCYAACGDGPPSCDYAPCPTYTGKCPSAQIDYDINPLEDVGNGGWGSYSVREIHAIYDLGSNTLSGDISGPAGTYTLSGTPGAANQARIVVEVSQK
jgi:hypothetical protein